MCVLLTNKLKKRDLNIIAILFILGLD